MTAKKTLQRLINLLCMFTLLFSAWVGAVQPVQAASEPEASRASAAPLQDLAPGEGPGGPILLIADPSNPFSRYYSEILLQEGLNEFSVANIGDVTTAALSAFDFVLLGEIPVSPEQVAMLTAWVEAGGNLLAMRPSKQLAGLFGLVDAGSTLDNGYLLINTGAPPGEGITNATMQIHGTADAYTISDATSLAALYSDRATAAGYPAVTLRNVGANGGKAAAFVYDLSKSVVLTRQGDPAKAGIEGNGDGRYSAADMFVGSWVDVERIPIPQADEQQRFLANLILYMNLADKPLPRFWYFPHGKRAALILTGDDHWGRSSPSGNSLAFFDRHKAQSPVGCSLQDWECIRSSSYMYGTNTFMTDAQVAQYSADGFEFALHPDAGWASGGSWCGNWTEETMTTNVSLGYADQMNMLRSAFPSMPQPLSERSHCYSWYGFADKAEAIRNHGVRMDVDVTYNPSSIWGSRTGYFAGTAMTMRFATETGELVDVYNAPTLVTDDNGNGAASTRAIIDTMLDWATGAQGYFSSFVINMHSDNWYGWSYAGSDEIVASAKAHNAAVVSGAQMVTWLDARNNSAFGSIAYTDIPAGKQLSFNITADPDAHGLKAMLPNSNGANVLSDILVDGSPAAFTLETIKGIKYAVFYASSGAYMALYTPDLTAPVISNVTAAPAVGGVAEITWTTHEEAGSRVDYGLTADNLNHSAQSTTPTNSHHISLTELLPNSDYFYRVTSQDEAGNISVWPAPPLAPALFHTSSAAFIDTTTADFNAGAPGTGTIVTTRLNGEVSLLPTMIENFNNNSLPAGWSTGTFAGGGTTTYDNGWIVLDGSRAGPTGLYGPGHSLEGWVTFNAAPFQHFGFGVTYTEPGWAIFSTGPDGSSLKARTNNTTDGMADVITTTIPGSYFGAPHHYRIDWLADRIDYYLDGALVASHSLTMPMQLRPMLADSNAGSPTLTADWVSMSPYAASGTFLSRIFDAHGTADWNTMTWLADTPTGSGIVVSVRTGDTYPPNDSTWTPFTPVAASGDTIPGVSRYLQYRVEFSTSDTSLTPVFKEMALLYDQVSVDQDAPQVIVASPANSATQVSLMTAVELTFDEPMDPATITTDSLQLRTQGGLLVPASVTYSGAVATLQPNAALVPGMTYGVSLSTAAADVSGNNLAAPYTLSFTTAAVGELIDTTQTDFSAGTVSAGLLVTGREDGEVTLLPTIEADFAGSALPPDWSSTGGTVTVSGGKLSVDGGRANPTANYPAGRSLEGVVIFRSTPLQHFGFGDTFSSGPWVIFSTGSDGTGIIARTNVTADISDDLTTVIPGNYLGAPHRYRIDWFADHVDYYLDGNLVATHALAITANMRPIAADSTAGGPAIDVDWMAMGSYPTDATFTSRIFDARGTANWGVFNWTAGVPDGSTLTFSVRSGDTYDPDDGSWTAFTPVSASGTELDNSSRYLQYRAVFTSVGGLVAPELRSVWVDFEVTTPDSAAPQIASRSPAAGAVDVSPTTNVIVTFNEPIDPATVTNTSFRLNAIGYGSESAAISISGPNATLDPSMMLMTSTTYQVTVEGSVSDMAGNPLGADSVWTFTTGSENASLAVEISPATQIVIEPASADFNVTVTNTGLVELADVQVMSTPAADCSRTIGALAPGASFPYTCSQTSPGASFNNTVDASGRSPSGRTINASDSAEVTVQLISQQPWLDPNWTYRRTIQVNSSCHQAVANYQIPILLTNANFDFAHAQADGRDLRITSADGVTLLPYFIESWDADGEQATVWIRFASLPQAGAYVFIYYGNAAAASAASTPETIFNFYDGFDGTALDAARWSFMPNTGNGNRTVSVDQGLLSSTATTTSGYFYSQMVSTQTFGTGVLMESRMRHATAVVNGNTAVETGFSPGTSMNNVIRIYSYKLANFIRRTTSSGTDSGEISMSRPLDATSFLLHRIYRSASGEAWFGLENDAWQVHTGASVPTGTMPAWFMVYSEAPANPGIMQMDWVRVRSFCGAESTAQVSSEQVFNSAPTAVNDAYTTDEDAALTVAAPGVLGNDSDPNDDALTAARVSGPAHGTLTLSADGGFSYTPDPNYSGPDSFTYTANDGTANSNTTTVSITITPVNDPPQLGAIGPKTVAELSLLSFSATATDGDSSTLTFSLEAGGGTIPNGAAITTGGAFTWTPTGEQGPVDYTFDVCVSDGAAEDCETITVSVLDTHSIDLVPGWNLVSFNLHPADTDTEDVLGSIADNYKLVYAWVNGEWQLYDPNADEFVNSLTDLDETMGLWVEMTAADTLVVAGTPPDSAGIPLYAGWNLVSFPGAGSLSLPQAFTENGVTLANLNGVMAMHAPETEDPWLLYDPAAPGYANDLTAMTPGWGYWINVDSDTLWTVP